MIRTHHPRTFLAVAASALFLRSAAAQTDVPRFEVGGHFALLQQRAFDTNDSGFGGRFTYNPTSLVGVEAELNYFPGDLNGLVPASQSRTAALFGIKAGWRAQGFGVFGKLRPGLIRFSEAEGGYACVTTLIWPPPLECIISGGSTRFALDFGGVIEFYPSRRTSIRLDLGDTMIRMPGPAWTKAVPQMSDFNVHNLQMNIGVGFRF